MGKYVTYICSRCSDTHAVNLSDILKAGKEVLPKGWIYTERGEDAEESYTLCHKCYMFWKKRTNELLRTFVKEDFNKVDR